MCFIKSAWNLNIYLHRNSPKFRFLTMMSPTKRGIHCKWISFPAATSIPLKEFTLEHFLTEHPTSEQNSPICSWYYQSSET